VISYVVATMWRYEYFVDFLEELVNHHLIGEIIIIDNDPTRRPISNVFLNGKIKILTTGENTFVNPAWNWGVREAQYDKVAIANDDIIFDLRVFQKIYNYITPDVGSIGLSVLPNEMHHVDGVIRVRDWNFDYNTFGFAMLMFVHKKSWEPIPEKLIAYFGDNFIFDNSLWNNRKIYLITDILYHSPYGQTGKDLPFLKEMFEKEKIFYAEVIRSKGYDPKIWCPEHYKE
jgi:hypothetical protein